MRVLGGSNGMTSLNAGESVLGACRSLAARPACDYGLCPRSFARGVLPQSLSHHAAEEHPEMKTSRTTVMSFVVWCWCSGTWQRP